MRIFACGGVSKDIDAKYLKGIDQIGESLTKQGHSLICVGSTTGTIGKIYNAFDKNDGKIKILVPLCYEDEAVGISSKYPSIMVRDLYMLQQIAITNSDATIVFPGGNGTLAELHMLTDNVKAGFHNNPIIVYNVNHYYDNLINTLNFLIEAKTMTKKQLKAFTFVTTPDEVIKAINQIKK